MKNEETKRIAAAEWDKIRASLKDIGDIGGLDTKAAEGINSSRGYNGLYLAYSLGRFEKDFSGYGYFTPEAAYVYVNLGWLAGIKLGLDDNFARSFGGGYSWVRTGFFDVNHAGDHRSVIKQLLFFQTFYPVEGDYDWEFESPEVGEKLRRVFNNFHLWQENPAQYVKGLRAFREKIEPLRRGLSRALGVPIPERSGSPGIFRYARYGHPEPGAGQYLKRR